MRNLRICLYGPTGSGKSTIADHIITKYGAELIKVSEPLRQLQEMFYEALGMRVSGQDGELLQFLAAKIEKESPGWLGRTAVRHVERSTSSFIVNDDCRLNSYAALRAAGFAFIRVKTSSELMIQRLRQDHSPVDPTHDVEKGFDQILMDHEIENNGPLKGTLAEVDCLVERLMTGRGSGVASRESPRP